LFPNLALREGHKCPICLGSVHVLCSVKCPECTDLQLHVTCNACARLVVPVLTTQVNTDTRNESPMEKMKDNTRKNKNPPKRKMSSKAKKHHQAAKLVPTKLKKYVTVQSFWLAVATRAHDTLIMQTVCFLTDDGTDGSNQNGIRTPNKV
jgi:hypothetical protein